jgi:hypothetical protein
MKSIYLILNCLFCFSLCSQAQQKKILRFEDETFDASAFKPFPLEVDIRKGEISILSFGHIIIKDKRADNSKLGIVIAGTNNEKHRFIFPGNKQEYLSERLNKPVKLSSSTQDTIILYLNNLWVFQTRKAWNGPNAAMTEDLIGNCYINTDVYSSQDGQYKYLGTIDTTLSANGWVANNCKRVLKKALLATLEASSSLFSKRDEIASSSSLGNKNTYPILLTQQPKQGIYTSYAEFLNDSPSITNFSAETRATIRVVKTPGLPDSVVAKSWGYCDETGIYMNVNKDFYKLNRSNNNFDLLGPIIVEVRNSTESKIFNTVLFNVLFPKPYIDLSSMVAPSVVTYNKLSYFQLNVSDGNLR